LTQQELLVPGEVAEILQDGKLHIVKIALRPCTLESPFEALKELHLGDRVLVNIQITIRDIFPVLNPEESLKK
jgi:hypothetical protein